MLEHVFGHDLDPIGEPGLSDVAAGHGGDLGQLDHRRAESGAGLAGGNGKAARAAADVEQMPEPRQIFGRGKQAAGCQRAAMQSAEDRRELVVRHGRPVMPCHRGIVADRPADAERCAPHVGVEFMGAAEVRRATAHEVTVSLRRVGEALALDRQQPGLHQRVEQGPELVRIHAKRLRDGRAGQRSILERREDIELHAGQHRQRRVDRSA